jgi:crossover junction endodeoxyribonuclease RuvC
MITVLGIDPGSHKTGWGVVVGDGSRLTHVASGIIVGGAGELPARLCAIADGLEDLLRRHTPNAVSVETIFHAKNSQSAIALGQARGVALLVAARAGAQVFEYTAGQIKQATTGRGRADKEQVAQMVSVILGVRDFAALDASDALAAAICHAQMHATPTAAFLREAMRGRR